KGVGFWERSLTVLRFTFVDLLGISAVVARDILLWLTPLVLLCMVLRSDSRCCGVERQLSNVSRLSVLSRAMVQLRSRETAFFNRRCVRLESVGRVAGYPRRVLVCCQGLFSRCCRLWRIRLHLWR